MTDQFPRGKLNDADEGQLEMRIGVRDKTIILDFGKPVVWFAMDYYTARSFIDNVMKRAQEIQPGTEEAGKSVERGDASWSYDNDAGAWYFKLCQRAEPPYTHQRRAEVIINLDNEGRLAGVELLEPLAPSRSYEEENEESKDTSEKV